MPRSFNRPILYDVDLLIRFHPVIRNFLRLMGSTEADPDYYLAGLPRPRLEIRDELYMQTNKSKYNFDSALSTDYPGYKVVNMNRSVGGSYLNTLDVECAQLPGNYGVRLVESFPSMFALDYRHRKSVSKGQKCLEDIYKVPDILLSPAKTDIPPEDEDSEEEVDHNKMPFTIKIPDLKDLINEFERDDDYLYNKREDEKHALSEQFAQGYEPPPRYEMRDFFGEAYQAFDAKITKYREILSMRLPSCVHDFNNCVIDPANKLFLR